MRRWYDRRMIRRVFVCGALLGAGLLGTPAANAQSYRWVDRDGNVHFTDTPPPASAKDVRKVTAPATPGGGSDLPYVIARLQKDFPITLYTTPSCKEACTDARNVLNRRGIPFKEVSVGDAATSEELRKVSGGLQVPTMLVGRQAEVGFEASSFNAALDSAGYPAEGTVPARTPSAASAPAAKPAPEAPKVKRGPYDPSPVLGEEPANGQDGASGQGGSQGTSGGKP